MRLVVPERHGHRKPSGVPETRRDKESDPAGATTMRTIMKSAVLTAVVALGTMGASKAQAQGFGLGIVTPGAAIGISSGYYGAGYAPMYGGGYGGGYGMPYSQGYGGGYWPGYGGVTPYAVAAPVVIQPRVIVQRPIYGGGYRGVGPGYYGGFRPHHGGYGNRRW